MSEQIDTICYKKNFLSEVIIRVDFLSPQKVLESDLPKELSNIAVKYFPIPEPKEAVEDKLEITKDQVKRNQLYLTHWNFHGKNRDKTLTYIPSAMHIKYLKYENYENAKKEFLDIMNVYFSQFNDTQIKRLGLRYINKISFLNEANPLKWNKYFNENLLKLIEFSHEKEKLARIFNNLEFSFDDFHLRFQFGMHNPDFPTPIKQKIFILDFDAYNYTIIEQGDLHQNMDLLHNKIQTYFEKSITDELREKMDE